MGDFEDFYTASQRSVLRAVVLVVGSQEEARDCVQEAYIRAAARWKSLQRDSAEAWVRRVALNLAIDGHRRHRVRQRWLQTAEPPDVIAPPDGLVIDVIAAVRALPRAQQQVVVLHYLLDMSVRDVALELGRPENTIKTQLQRARTRLTVLLPRDLEPVPND